MTTEQPPLRLLEQPDTGPAARSLLEAGRQAGRDLEPPDGLQDQLWSRLQARLGDPPTSPPGAGPAPSNTGLWIGVGGAVGVGALLVGLLAGPQASSVPAPSGPGSAPLGASVATQSPSARAPEASRPLPGAQQPETGAQTGVVSGEPSASANVRLDDLPAQPKSPAGLASGASAPSGSALVDVGAESQLVQDARARLRSGDAAGALSALSDADARFPRGTLALERRVLGILALDRAGRKAEAARQAAAFLAAHPDSPHAERLRAIGK